MTIQNRKLIFLKSTGILIGEITEETDESLLDLTQFNVREVQLNEELSEYWHGDYETGTVKSRLDKPVMVESVVKYSTNTKILTTYPIHNQVNIIIDMLKQSGIPQTADFTNMVAYLDAEIQKHKDKIASYSSNSDAYVWVSSAEEEAEYKRKKV